MVVKFQVERRPISANGKIYRGSGYGDYITVMSHAENIEFLAAGSGVRPKRTNWATSFPISTSQSPAHFVPVGAVVPPLGTQSPALSHVQEISGEPWLVHSSHHAIDSAIESAAPLAGAIGAENVRIVKVLSHSTNFKLN